MSTCAPSGPETSKDVNTTNITTTTITTTITTTTNPVEEDQEEVLLAVQDPELQNVLKAHWGSVRTFIARGPVQTRFNYRLVSRNTRSMELRQILEQTTVS